MPLIHPVQGQHPKQSIWRTAATRAVEKVQEHNNHKAEAREFSIAREMPEKVRMAGADNPFAGRRRELTEEEKRRLEQLKDELAMLLAKGDETTADDERRMKEIAKEIESLTGANGLSKASISDAVEKLKKTDGKDEDDEQGTDSTMPGNSQFGLEMRMRSMALPEMELEAGPGLMSFLRKSASEAYGRVAAMGRQ
jgi:hypothetical protein